MLEQVQRGAPAAVEELHVVGLGVEVALARQAGDQRIEFGQPCSRQRAFGMEHLADLRQVGAQLGVGIAEQPGQRAQRARRGLRAARKGCREQAHGQISAWIGMVRRFSLPNRLVSPVPSEQPLPKLKPQPPRTLKVFSAYSRCVLGMTKRSS